MELSNKTLVLTMLAILLICLAVGGYFWWKYSFSGTNALDEAGETLNKIIEGATKGVLPSIQTNPLENKPDINPVDKANPFKNIKTNPF